MEHRYKDKNGNTDPFDEDAQVPTTKDKHDDDEESAARYRRARIIGLTINILAALGLIAYWIWGMR